ncbi:hypothetical protein MKX03_033267, partial [Papaver bracteatum]
RKRREKEKIDKIALEIAKQTLQHRQAQFQQQQVVFGPSSKSFPALIQRHQIESAQSSNSSFADIQPKNSKIQTSKREPQKKVASEAVIAAQRKRREKEKSGQNSFGNSKTNITTWTNATDSSGAPVQRTT